MKLFDSNSLELQSKKSSFFFVAKSLLTHLPNSPRTKCNLHFITKLTEKRKKSKKSFVNREKFIFFLLYSFYLNLNLEIGKRVANAKFNPPTSLPPSLCPFCNFFYFCRLIEKKKLFLNVLKITSSLGGF